MTDQAISEDNSSDKEESEDHIDNNDEDSIKLTMETETNSEDGSTEFENRNVDIESDHTSSSDRTENGIDRSMETDSKDKSEDDKNSEKTKHSKKETHDETSKTLKRDDKKSKDIKDKKESRRSETPPLKRLMRQDPLPLFMNNNHHSPSKKAYKEENLGSTKWQVPLVPSPAFLANIKNAPMHPRQHILKSKPYSNRLFLSPSTLSSMSSMGYPPHSKSFDNDQPLDLSKKTGSLKSSSSSSSSSSGSRKRSSTSPSDIHLKSRHKYSNGLLNDSLKSSLQSLQQKFGGDYHSRMLQKPLQGLHALSYDLYSKAYSADNILLSSMASLPKKKSPVPTVSEVSEKSVNGKSENTTTNHKDLNSNIKNKTSVEFDEDKHTRHKCVCTKSFTSLYELSLHIQETGHVPAGVKKANLMEYPKLVRGQDMWLNTESEQTKRILRCMQCGESFKSLPMLTVHMMQTQHYTKIVSSEHGRRTHKCSSYCDRDLDRECVFKCKVCNSMFVDMEGLANHMILSGHHKRNVLHTKSPSRTLSASETQLNQNGNSKKLSLPQLSPLHDRASVSSPDSDLTDDSMITCENCGDRIETNHFVEHVRGCLHKTMVEAFESRIEKLKSQVNSLQAKTVKEEISVEEKSPEEMGQESLSETKTELVKTETEDNESSDVKFGKEVQDQKDENVESKDERQIKTEPETDEEDKSKERNPKSVDSAKTFDILDPENSAKKLDILNPEAEDGKKDDGNSALQAMESFIQKSFSSKYSYGKNRFKVNIFDKQDTLSPLLKFEKYRKYFQPSLLMENRKTSDTESDNNETKDCSKDELGKLEKLCENVNKAQPSPKSSSKSENLETDEVKVSSESLCKKYLNIEEEEEQNSSEKSSALDSLSSFVYGQSMDTEHPLDKLQKLITKSDIPGMSSAHSGLHGSPECSNPLNLSLKKELDEEEMMEELLSDGTHSDSGSDSAVEYHCVACSRHFASKGTYRYHLSRCHLSTIKKYGIKEAFNMSPYVYLPLDHTAKFTRFFKMAEELVKKEKS